MTFLYFDAGLGAMIAQGLVAGVAVVVLFYKSLVYKVKLLFGLVKEEDFDSIDIDDTDTELDEHK